MKRVLISAVALAALLIFNACSSSDEKSAKTISNENVNGTTTVKSGEQVTAPQSADANTLAASPGDPIQNPNSNGVQSKIDASKKGSGGPINNAEVEEMALKNGKPAPENSTFASFLTDQGYEVRVFKDNPQLLKVVKTIGSEKSSIKVYLRGGRVVDLTGNAIINLGTVPSSTILAAAGVQPPPPPASSSNPNGEKKKGQ